MKCFSSLERFHDRAVLGLAFGILRGSNSLLHLIWNHEMAGVLKSMNKRHGLSNELIFYFLGPSGLKS